MQMFCRACVCVFFKGVMSFLVSRVVRYVRSWSFCPAVSGVFETLVETWTFKLMYAVPPVQNVL